MITRTNIINLLIDKYKFQTYLEIGVRTANDNFNHIKVVMKEGVDPAPITPVKYKMTSDDFFKNHINKKYDIIFVDGLHTAEQVYKDVINSIDYLNDGGVIVMHDCNPPTEYHIRSYEEYLKTRGQWNGDVFAGFIKLKKDLKDWNCFVINEDFGCGIITQRNLSKKFESYDDIPENIDWEYFDSNRENLLDLVSYDEFKIIIK
jgi:ABC-type amino acid transport substrate-binding protein